MIITPALASSASSLSLRRVRVRVLNRTTTTTTLFHFEFIMVLDYGRSRFATRFHEREKGKVALHYHSQLRPGTPGQRSRKRVRPRVGFTISRRPPLASESFDCFVQIHACKSIGGRGLAVSLVVRCSDFDVDDE